MKFLADVNVTKTVIQFLKENEHDVLDVKQVDRQMTDKKIIALARNEQRIVITHDKDFLELLKYPKDQVGIILIRLRHQNSQNFCLKLKELFETYTDETLNKSLTIVEETFITLRSFPF